MSMARGDRTRATARIAERKGREIGQSRLLQKLRYGFLQLLHS